MNNDQRAAASVVAERVRALSECDVMLVDFDFFSRKGIELRRLRDGL